MDISTSVNARAGLQSDLQEFSDAIHRKNKTLGSTEGERRVNEEMLYGALVFNQLIRLGMGVLEEETGEVAAKREHVHRQHPQHKRPSLWPVSQWCTNNIRHPYPRSPWP